MELFLAAALLSLESLLLLRALRQRAALRPLAPNEMSPGPDAAAVEMIVPVRNEAQNIRDCLEGLVRQIYPPGKLRITVVDDDSEDGTDEIIASFAKSHPCVRCLRSDPLQPGWTGKTQACWRGAAASSFDAEWLGFIDADMRVEPSLIASAVSEAERGLGLLSLAPKHRLVSFAERLMIPCGLYLLGFRQDLATIHSRGGETNVAGQFMLIRRSAYQQVGGHAAVAAAICEDLELAKLMKRSGFSIALMDGSQLLSTRMYSGWGTLWPGFAKNVLQTFGGVGSTLTTAAVAVVMSWSVVILPAVGYARDGGSLEGSIAFALAVAAAAVAVGFHLAGAAHFRVPLWYGLLFPIAYTLGGIIALDGLRRRLTGRVPWKGRVYRVYS